LQILDFGYLVYSACYSVAKVSFSIRFSSN